MGAERPNLQGLDWHVEVVVRGGGAREVEDPVKGPVHGDGLSHVVLHK